MSDTSLHMPVAPMVPLYQQVLFGWDSGEPHLDCSCYFSPGLAGPVITFPVNRTDLRTGQLVGWDLPDDFWNELPEDGEVEILLPDGYRFDAQCMAHHRTIWKMEPAWIALNVRPGDVITIRSDRHRLSIDLDDGYSLGVQMQAVDQQKAIRLLRHLRDPEYELKSSLASLLGLAVGHVQQRDLLRLLRGRCSLAQLRELLWQLPGAREAPPGLWRLGAPRELRNDEQPILQGREDTVTPLVHSAEPTLTGSTDHAELRRLRRERDQLLAQVYALSAERNSMRDQIQTLQEEVDGLQQGRTAAATIDRGLTIAQEFTATHTDLDTNTHDVIRDFLLYAAPQSISFEVLYDVVDTKISQDQVAVRNVLSAFPYFVTDATDCWMIDIGKHSDCIAVLASRTGGRENAGIASGPAPSHPPGVTEPTVNAQSVVEPAVPDTVDGLKLVRHYLGSDQRNAAEAALQKHLERIRSGDVDPHSDLANLLMAALVLGLDDDVAEFTEGVELGTPQHAVATLFCWCRGQPSLRLLSRRRRRELMAQLDLNDTLHVAFADVVGLYEPEPGGTGRKPHQTAEALIAALEVTVHSDLTWLPSAGTPAMLVQMLRILSKRPQEIELVAGRLRWPLETTRRMLALAHSMGLLAWESNGWSVTIAGEALAVAGLHDRTKQLMKVFGQIAPFRLAVAELVNMGVVTLVGLIRTLDMQMPQPEDCTSQARRILNCIYEILAEVHVAERAQDEVRLADRVVVDAQQLQDAVLGENGGRNE